MYIQKPVKCVCVRACVHAHTMNTLFSNAFFHSIIFYLFVVRFIVVGEVFKTVVNKGWCNKIVWSSYRIHDMLSSVIAVLSFVIQESCYGFIIY